MQLKIKNEELRIEKGELNHVKNYSLFIINSKLARKAAFTLAEVLITLGIIGVVAALTMPTLIANYQKHVTINQLKKAYSEMSQVIKRAEVTYGSLQEWNFSGLGTQLDMDKYFAENYIFPNLKIIKSCFPSSGECWADKVYYLSGNEVAHSTQYANETPKAASFTTASGYNVYFWLGGSGNSARFAVDINGSKKPNKFGKDIFGFFLDFKNGKLLLAGNEYSLTKDEMTDPVASEQNGCCDTCTGLFCAGLIAIDGWQIKGDYPW